MSQTRPQDPKFFEFFWELSSVESGVRNKAALALLETLVTRQKEFSATNSQQRYCPELGYALSRLVRGLASNREGARQGFVLALTEILRHIDQIQTQDVIDEILKHHAIKGSNLKRGEEKEKLLGMVFGVAALHRSGRMAQLFTHEIKEKFMKNVIVPFSKELITAMHKDVTAEIAVKIFISLLEFVTKEDFKKHLLPLLLPHLTIPPDNFSPEHLLIVLYMSKRFEYDISTLNTSWTHRNVLHPEHSQHLISILKRSLSRAPHVHLIWSYIVEYLTTSTDSLFALQSFWTNVMDELFKFGGVSSKANALHVVQKIASSIVPEHLPLLLSPTFISLLVRVLTSKSHPLHRVAKHTLQAIVTRAQKSSPVAFGIAVTLQKKLPNFDNATHTKTIQSLMQSVKFDDAKEYIVSVVAQFYKQSSSPLTQSSAREQNEVDNTDDDNIIDKTIEKRRIALLDQLLALARVTSLLDNKLEYTLSLLRFLFFHSYFALKEDAEETNESEDLLKLKLKLQPPLTATVQKACRERFNTLLSFLTSRHFDVYTPETDENSASSEKRKKRDSELRALKNSVYWANYVVQFQRKLRRDKSVVRVAELTERETAAEKDALKLVKSIQKELQNISTENIDTKENHERQIQLFAFELLCLHVILNMNEEPKESVEVLQDLLQCYKRLFKEETMAYERVERVNNEPKPIVVMTEVFCSLLLKESAILRDVVQKTFAAFSSRVTEESLAVLMDAFTNPKAVVVEDEESASSFLDEENENDENQTPSEGIHSTKLSMHQISNVERNEDDGEDVDKNVSDTNVRGNVEEGNGNASSESSDEDTPSQEENNVMSTEESEKTEKKSDENSTESEAVADDEEMFELEKKIAAALKERKELKAAKKKMLIQITHFRFKVFGLIEIFAKKCPRSPLLLNLYPSLSKAASELINNKGPGLALAQKLIKFISQQRTYLLDAEEKKAHEIIEKLFKVVQKTTHREVALAIANAICSIVKSLVNTEKHTSEFGVLDMQKFMELFEKSYSHFTTHKSSPYYAEFFRLILKHNPHVGWKLLPKIIQLSVDAATPYIYGDNMTHIKDFIQNKKIKEKYKERFGDVLPLFKLSLLQFLERQGYANQKLTAKPKSLSKIIKTITEIIKQFIDAISLQKVQQSLNHTAVIKSLDKLQQMLPNINSLTVSLYHLKSLLQEGVIKPLPKQKKEKRKEESTSLSQDEKETKRAKHQKEKTANEKKETSSST
jgi:DNA polymerase phi